MGKSYLRHPSLATQSAQNPSSTHILEPLCSRRRTQIPRAPRLCNDQSPMTLLDWGMGDSRVWVRHGRGGRRGRTERPGPMSIHAA